MSAQMYINGEWTSARSGEKREVVNPANEDVVQEVAYGGRKDAELAIDAAALTFGAWRAKSTWERAEILKRTAQLIRERADALSRTLTLEQGKPLAESRGEL